MALCLVSTLWWSSSDSVFYHQVSTEELLFICDLGKPTANLFRFVRLFITTQEPGMKKRYRHEEKTQHWRNWKASGLSQQAYCG
jgi:hypothetical protein